MTQYPLSQFLATTEEQKILKYHPIKKSAKKKLQRNLSLPNQLEYILTPGTLNHESHPFVPFFWHIPKAAGSYVRHVCSDGYSLRPQADLGQPEKLDMFLRRMQGVHRSPKDKHDAKKQCNKFISAGLLKHKFLSGCIDKESLSKSEHKCLPNCFDFIQTPLIYDAEKVFKVTPKKARVATILRDPVERFVSLFNYLKTATWEPTYHPTNLTLNEYILTGEYKRHKDNGNWMVCTLSKCGDSNINATTKEDLAMAKHILSNMLVGFTDMFPEFFERLEAYWEISQGKRQKARHGAMKEKINVNKHRKHTTGLHLSPEAVITLHNSVSRDIELYNYARSVLWEEQASLFRDSKK